MYRPLSKNVLLSVYHKEKSSNSLFLGNNNTNAYRVLNVGKETIEVKVNDVVYINEDKKVRICIDNNEYFIINENDIYLISEE